jgi:hypothetical protein
MNSCKKLGKSLKRGGHAAIISHALYGLGGMGKTRAAVEYAWAHQNEYTALLFVVAETPEAVRRNLAGLASALLPKLETTDDAARLQAVLDWLTANLGWFLILDNVDSKEALAEVEGLLGGLSGGHLLVTSRLANFSGHFRPLELDVLAVEDAASFLLARTEGRRRRGQDDDAKAREVATELGRLALALEQAAAFIAKRRLTFEGYLGQWHAHRDVILGWFDATVTGYPRAVAVTWQTSVAQLSENGRRLLERLAWLAPEKVPEFLLDVPIPGAEAESLHDALDDLTAYSLVTRDARVLSSSSTGWCRMSPAAALPVRHGIGGSWRHWVGLTLHLKGMRMTFVAGRDSTRLSLMRGQQRNTLIRQVFPSQHRDS